MSQSLPTAAQTQGQAARYLALIEQWKSDAGGTYQSWFLWEERLKNFARFGSGLKGMMAVSIKLSSR